MPIVHEALKKELDDYVTAPDEHQRIGAALESADLLLQEIAYAVLTGKHIEVDRLISEALRRGHAANVVLDDGLLPGMAIVGVKFRDNAVFVPEVLTSARAMKTGMSQLEPLLSQAGVEPIGTVAFGTVKGDLHDIGKNLCITMLRGSGFNVHDLGVDNTPEDFIDAIVEHGAQILAMSALLTTTMPNMGRIIQAIEEAGLRDKVHIMVGGAPVTQDFADEMGADAYGANAASCVDTARQLLGVTA